MASIDTAIYSRLAAFAGLAALVSTRIYPAPIPDDPTYPLVTFQQISGIRDHVYGGQTGFVQSRFQLDSWAATSVGARALAEQVRLALSTWHGTSDTVVINYIRMDNEIKMYDDEADLHRVIQDFIITYTEDVPA